MGVPGYSPEEVKNAIAHYESLENQQSAKGTAPTSAEDVEACRQQVAIDVFHSLVHGMRIQAKIEDDPELIAGHLLDIHEALMSQATHAGIIPPLEPK